MFPTQQARKDERSNEAQASVSIKQRQRAPGCTILSACSGFFGIQPLTRSFGRVLPCQSLVAGFRTHLAKATHESYFKTRGTDEIRQRHARKTQISRKVYRLPAWAAQQHGPHLAEEFSTQLMQHLIGGKPEYVSSISGR